MTIDATSWMGFASTRAIGDNGRPVDRPSSPGVVAVPLLTARTLLVVFDAVYLLALAAWVGGIAFFSFGVAPIIFKVLGKEVAAKFVRALFPRYYAWGAIAGALALPACMGGPLCFPEYRGIWVGAQALVILLGILIMFYCGQTLTPAINAARDAGPDGQGRFDRLHRRSVRLNALALLLGVGLLAAFAARRLPTSPGIVEESPQERARRAAALQEQIDRAAELRARAMVEGMRGQDSPQRHEEHKAK